MPDLGGGKHGGISYLGLVLLNEREQTLSSSRFQRDERKRFPELLK
jgi:hypothetical protein